MTRQEMFDLQPGDLVVSRFSGISYIVSGNYGGRATAVRTVDLTNPDEWQLSSVANHAPPPVEKPLTPGERLKRALRWI